jgi:hypothetical protein
MIIGKACGKCRGSLPLSISVGDSCPHCGALFDDERDSYVPGGRSARSLPGECGAGALLGALRGWKAALALAGLGLAPVAAACAILAVLLPAQARASAGALLLALAWGVPAGWGLCGIFIVILSVLKRLIALERFSWHLGAAAGPAFCAVYAAAPLLAQARSALLPLERLLGLAIILDLGAGLLGAAVLLALALAALSHSLLSAWRNLSGPRARWLSLALGAGGLALSWIWLSRAGDPGRFQAFRLDLFTEPALSLASRLAAWAYGLRWLIPYLIPPLGAVATGRVLDAWRTGDGSPSEFGSHWRLFGGLFCAILPFLAALALKKPPAPAIPQAWRVSLALMGRLGPALPFVSAGLGIMAALLPALLSWLLHAFIQRRKPGARN